MTKIHADIIANVVAQFVAAKQPIGPRELIKGMMDKGYKPQEVRRAVQIAFERGLIRLNEQMQVVLTEHALAA